MGQWGGLRDTEEWSRLDEGLPTEGTPRMSEVRWDHRRGRVGEASMCSGRGEHDTFKERKEVRYNWCT